MLIAVMQVGFFRDKSILVNSDHIQRVEFVDRNYTEPVANLHMADGTVIKTNCYRKELMTKDGGAS
jgi:hypothetical protein